MERADVLGQYFDQHDGTHPNMALPKHSKMAASAFRFFRGSAPLMYRDMANDIIALPQSLFELPLTNVLGDCHASNFGFLSEEGSHGETLVFSPNDFDDACVGHAVWDLFRFLVSLPLAQQEGALLQSSSDDMKLRQKPLADKAQVLQAQHTFIDSYVATCEASLRGENNNQSALTEFSQEHILHKRWQKGLQRLVGGAAFNLKSSLAKEVDLNNPPLRFKEADEKFSRLHEDFCTTLVEYFRPYVDDEIIDCVERLDAGTGSNNLKRYYLLVGPKFCSSAELYHIVEVKQQQLAAPLHYYTDLSPTNRLNHAHLTVNCQRKMQRRPDLVLDDALWQGTHWLVRSRHHARVGIDPEHIVLGKRAAQRNGLSQYAEACAMALAYAHMRGDRRSLMFQQVVADILPVVKTELLNAANIYASQVEQDWGLFCSLRK
ncbi:hypothetical protein PRUB_b1333 [Pseudoalteromonas rubra]|uniref:DUF2252 domain-containing protein n=1 Tax=Pseudoalteromonas rubra TaxID=43658 RepID=A0A8T0C2Q8_9GAMM|nr:DUF2252 family protein [Pseudoalteromonas rubra]KAF7781954.1 hypothetical protein PRUB_b1333 [Pseudoalteromonas rubra]